MARKKVLTKKQRIKNHLRSIANSQKRTMTPICVRYHNENDKAILEKLSKVPNKADYIRQLILNDIEKGN